MDKHLGKRLEGRYEIQEMIGMGGMANVYKAYDVIDQRTVAVKILRDEYLDNNEFLRRFKNESKAIAVLSHPNIVRVYDVSFTNRIHSIVMEYIDGITLKDYIERQGVIGWKEAVHFTLQILRALQHAHDRGIVHRDIKPQNIMLLQDGTIKVTDFGIARFARSEVRTITDRAIGSVHYISPEQAMGDNTDEKSDLYSVGVMLFEMLTGQLPFEADTAVSVALKQIQTQAVRPRSLNRDIPEGLEEITVRAMQKDAAKRYRSAAEMIDDIERFKQNPSIHFEYKYMETESEASKSKKYRRAITETRDEDVMQKKRRTPYIPILTGVTLAFVLASLGFIGLMISMNNPFTTVEDFELPNLVGLKYDTVTNQYDDFEIVEEAEREFSDEYGKGVIYEQKPSAGTKIKVGSVVRVRVSSGQRVVTLPNFAGKDAIQVFNKLTDLGLEYKEVRINSSDIPTGSVIYTDPSKDSQLTSGDPVTVYVSLGPEEQLANVPSLKGLRVEDATKLLERNRLRLGTVTEETSDQPSGTIVAQNPDSGDLQPEGTAIDVVVSKEGLKRLTIPVALPSVDRSITVRARVGDDEIVVEEGSFNPVRDDVTVWRPVFSGTEDDTETRVRIYIDGRLYQEYMLDFSTDNRVLTRDRSEEEEFQ